MSFRLDLFLALLVITILCAVCGADSSCAYYTSPISLNTPWQNPVSDPDAWRNSIPANHVPGLRAPISNPPPAPLSPVVAAQHYRGSDYYRPVSNPYPVYTDPEPRYRYASHYYWNDDDYRQYYPYNSYYSSNYYYRSGTIQILSTPAGASVYLNNKYRGRTPHTGYLDISSLQPGTYDLLIQYDDYLPYTSTIYVERGQVRTVNVVLTPETGRGSFTGSMQIQSDPGDAQVFLNHQFMGITPVYLTSLTPGEYTLTLQKEGYASYISVVQVIEGQTLPITAVLSGLPATPATPVPTATPIPTQTPVPAPTRAGLPVTVVLFGLIAGLFCVSRR
nr:PEGA domain-containing protein [uncultured Methanospirillum sp.]